MEIDSTKSVIPKPMPRWAIITSVAALAIVSTGIVLGTNALNDYRADIEASQAEARDYYEAAAEQMELANQAAEEAAESAELAGEAVTAAEAEEAAAAAAAAAAEAAEAAAAANAPRSGGGASYGEYPAGTPVPFVASSDPEDASGGSYDTSACASNSASTVNGVPTCD